MSKKRTYRHATSIAPQAVQPSRRLNLSPDVRGGLAQPLPPTPEDISRLYGPAKTLGAPEDVQLAMDARLADSGVYSLLQHSLELGVGIAPQFMGYGVLQNLAQNGLIRACVETVSDDMTRAWIEFKREGEGGDESLLTDLAQACKRFALQRLFHEATELVGYEGGAFLFIDTGSVGQELERPLNVSPYSAELRPGGVLRFVVIDPVNVFPGDYNSLSPLEPDYFRPRWWWVLGKRVHASRLIRLVANECPVLLRPAYNFLGIPQAQILWDYVLHFQECRAAEARLLTKFSLTVFKTKMEDILYAAGGTAQIDTRIRYMIQTMTNDGVLAVDKESEDVVKLETPLSGVTDIVRQSLEILAALNRTPAVKLLGISPSGFNATGESDIRNYYDHVRSQQEKVLRDGIKKALDCIQLYLRGTIDPSVTFDFAPLGEEDRAALATLQKTKADTIAVYMDRDIISQEEARQSLASDPDSGFSDIDPAEVPQGNGMPDALPETGEEGLMPDIDDVDKAGAVYG
jgi:phage-related protein (TIGR01555 family)